MHVIVLMMSDTALLHPVIAGPQGARHGNTDSNYILVLIVSLLKMTGGEKTIVNHPLNRQYSF